MPGYPDWKIRNCTDGAIAKAKSLHQTMEMVDPYLHEIWEAHGGRFPETDNAKLLGVVARIDAAEDALEKAKLSLAEFFPGHP